MGVLSTLFEPRAIAPPPAYNYETLPFLGGSSAAGIRVTEEGSLRSTAVLAAVRIIAESIASLPLVIYQQQGRNKERATTHPLFPLLHDLANPEMTAMEWRETMMGHVVLWGTAYSEIDWSGSGQPRGFWPLRPDKAQPIRKNGRLWLKYELSAGDTVLIPWQRIFSLRGLGNDGLIGYSPIAMAMQAVGLTLATEQYGAGFFGNGARPGGVLEHPGRLSPNARDALRSQWTELHSGLNNAQRVAILEEGMAFKSIGVPPEEAQFLETRKFQISEIARMFRVPPHMLADLDRATFSNIEHQSLEFVIYTLRPWLVRFEQAIYRDLLQPGERGTFFAKHVIEGLLRGDTSSRYASYQSAINAGWMVRNEARELEDLNPLEGLDDALVPLNMIEVGQAIPAPGPTREEHEHPELRLSGDVSEPQALEARAMQTATARREAMRRMVRLWEDAAGRAVRRETADIRRSVGKLGSKRSQEDFFAWLANFYEEMRGWLPGYFEPLMRTYAEQMLADVGTELGDPVDIADADLRKWITEYLANMTAVWTIGSERQLRTLVLDAEDDAAAMDAVNERMDGWEETKASKTGLDQAFEAGNALVILGYTRAAVESLAWQATGESCPFCQNLDGRRIPISGSFAKEGQTLEAEGVAPLPMVRNVRHGPLHAGCDCVVVAG